jgi:hypothetical protein
MFELLDIGKLVTGAQMHCPVLKRGDVCVVRHINWDSSCVDTEEMLRRKDNEHFGGWNSVKRAVLRIEPQGSYKEWMGCFSYLGNEEVNHGS